MALPKFRGHASQSQCGGGSNARRGSRPRNGLGQSLCRHEPVRDEDLWRRERCYDNSISSRRRDDHQMQGPATALIEVLLIRSAPPRGGERAPLPRNRRLGEWQRRTARREQEEMPRATPDDIVTIAVHSRPEIGSRVMSSATESAGHRHQCRQHPHGLTPDREHRVIQRERERSNRKEHPGTRVATRALRTTRSRSRWSRRSNAKGRPPSPMRRKPGPPRPPG